ncbi:MAG TPA: hypothetical protein VK712_02325 [Verrucomicrobiae bacterium]|jgi:hypothetical protein|nr:hypothetical protein [Verrucomicrobiae bacterium]
MSKASEIVNALLEDIQESDAKLFHDQYGEPYIALQGNGQQVLKLNSKDFKQWLAQECYTKFNKPLSTEAITKVILTLSGIATFKGDGISLHTRSTWEGDHLWYDNGKGEPAILISPGQWKVTPTYPILFRRFGHQKPQVWPVKASVSDVELLNNYVNIKSEQQMLLFVVYTIAAFIPGFPHPLLLLHGPQGAGKSTPMRVLKELIDPSGIHALSQPHNDKEFAQQGHHHAFLFYDNLSTLPTWFSDALARASTGDGISKRALYTDDDDVFYKLQLPIGINAISQVILKPDLLDRAILLKLSRIESEERKSEREFWANFYDDKPKILGAIYEVIAVALTIVDSVKLDKLPRMADFAKWGCAVAQAIGFEQQDFISAYQANIDSQNDEAIYASSVAQAIIVLMNGRNEWLGTPSELLGALTKIALEQNLETDRTWPKGPVWLTRRINEVEPNLKERNIEIDHGPTAAGRMFKLTNSHKPTVNAENTDIPDDSNSVKTVNS